MFVVTARMLCVCVVMSFAAQTSAQNEHLIGRKVMTIKWDTEFKEGNSVTFKSELGKVYEIHQVDRERLWLVGNGRKGWVKRTDVVPFEEAIDHFSRLIRQDPSSINYYHRAAAWPAKEEYDKAILDYNEAIRLDPKYVYAYVGRGLAWTEKGENDKAIADYDEAIRLDPKYTLPYNNRGKAWRAKKDYDKAIADYDEAIRLDLRYVNAHIGRGLAWSDKGDCDKAIDDYDEAIRLDPKSDNAYNNRGIARYAKEEYDKAIADYNEAIRLDPKYALAYNNRGNVWSDKGENDKAIADYDEAIRLDPKRALTYNNRGIAWYAKEEYDKAIADYNEAIRLDSREAYAHNGLAFLHAACPDAKYRNGRKAVEYGTKACQLSDWKNALFLSTLAEAYTEKGDFANAIAMQEKAVGMVSESEKALFQKGLDALHLKKFIGRFFYPSCCVLFLIALVLCWRGKFRTAMITTALGVLIPAVWLASLV